jgi:hypothetical protein
MLALNETVPDIILLGDHFMATHPVNLGLRFLLEITALVGIGYWGWESGTGWIRYLLAIFLPLIAAIVWGTFTVPEDPSRSGKAPVSTPGWLRLILELAIFGLASWAYFAIDAKSIFWIFSVLIVGHYLFSLDRLKWLLSR